MGYVKPERRNPEHWRGRAETVGQMRRQGWDVTSRCSTCQFRIRLDTEATVRLHGEHVSLWNHRQSCPRIECDGQVRFWARPPELMQPIELTSPWPADREPEWWLKPTYDRRLP